MKYFILNLFLFTCGLSLAQNPVKIKRNIKQFEVDTCFLAELKSLKINEKSSYDEASIWLIQTLEVDKKSYVIVVTAIPEIFYYENSGILACFYLDASLYIVSGDIINNLFSYKNERKELVFSIPPNIIYIDTLTQTILELPDEIHHPTWIYWFENGVLRKM